MPIRGEPHAADEASQLESDDRRVQTTVAFPPGSVAAVIELPAPKASDEVRVLLLALPGPAREPRGPEFRQKAVSFAESAILGGDHSAIQVVGL